MSLLGKWWQTFPSWKPDPGTVARATNDPREGRILMLCREAHAKGWRFSPMNYTRTPNCGCALQAIQHVLGIESWGEAGRKMGIEDVARFGGGFDVAFRGEIPNGDYGEEYDLGGRVAKRLKAEGLA